MLAQVVLSAVFPVALDQGAEIGLAHVHGLHDLHFCVVVTQYAHIQAKGLQLFQEHLEGFRDTRFRDVLTLDDGFVSLHTSYHIVGFHRQDLLQRVGSAVGLQGPYFHLSETLTAELGFSSQRLLGNQ